MKVLGIMSGTSLDGLDLALVDFNERDPARFAFLATATYPYEAEWEERLRRAYEATARQLARLDADFGLYIGRSVNRFLEETGAPRPDLIASHGQTIFHEPDRHYTCQIGSGPHIAAATGLPVIYDFRRQDVALGGQGAPLVPIGDKMLFSQYDYCLNIGGFANISFDDDQGLRRAFDTGPANIVLNYLARRLGKPYDEGGRIARRGQLIPALLEQLDDLPYYREAKPKSLGWEFVESSILPLLDRAEAPVEDLLHTFVHHIARQIARFVKPGSTVLVTGGGAYNDFLIHTIEHYSRARIVVPEARLIDFKEALVFALLGYLRARNRINILASVTGACCDHSAGLRAEAPPL